MSEPGPRCSKCGTASCLEDRNSGWYDDEQPIVPWNAPQPTPSVPASADVAAVLDGLVQEMRLVMHQPWGGSGVQYGLRRAITLVEAAQRKAATGARATGGDDLILSRAEAIVESALFYDDPQGRGRVFRWLDQWTPRDADPYLSMASEAVVTGLFRAGLLCEAAAPPAPSAHGVAELASKQRQIEQLHRDLVNVRAEALREGRRGVAALLAECERRQAGTGEYAFITETWPFHVKGFLDAIQERYEDSAETDDMKES